MQVVVATYSNCLTIVDNCDKSTNHVMDIENVVCDVETAPKQVTVTTGKRRKVDQDEVCSLF